MKPTAQAEEYPPHHPRSSEANSRLTKSITKNPQPKLSDLAKKPSYSMNSLTKCSPSLIAPTILLAQNPRNFSKSPSFHCLSTPAILEIGQPPGQDDSCITEACWRRPDQW